VSGSLRVETGETPAVRGSLDSQHVDASRWMAAPRDDGAPAAPAGGRVFGDAPLPLADPLPVRLDLRWTAARLTTRLAQNEDVEMGLMAEPRKLVVDPLTWRGPHGGALSVHFSADGLGDAPRVAFRASGKDVRLALREDTGIPTRMLPPMELDIDLRARGATPRQLASSLDGHVIVYQGEGPMAMRFFRLLYADVLTQIIKALNPNAPPSGVSQMECAVVGASVSDGVATVKPMVIRTRETTALSSGTVDFGKETVDLRFNTVAREGLGISAGMLVNPFFKIGGTLQSPSLEVDAARGVISGGAAVATAGLSILAKGFVDRILHSGDPCGDAREYIEKRRDG
jgi:hypothetical protein